jgi:hypothetical protein
MNGHRTALGLVLGIAIAGCSTSGGDQTAQPDAPTQSASADCKIDAVKMCTEIDTGGTAASAMASAGAAPYGSTSTPDAVDFQIPAGVELRLMCYFDPTHTTVTRADATPRGGLDAPSIQYLKSKNFCS